MVIAAAPPARPRTLVHPGPFNPVRIRSMHTAQGRHFRLVLQPGRSLYQSIVEPLWERGVRSASMTLLGGSFSALWYCVAGPDAHQEAVAAYSAPIDAGPSWLVFGNATLGFNAAGEPLVHCHAVFRDANGAIKGGHILTDRLTVGELPLTVLVTTLDGFELRVSHDAETNISLLRPVARPVAGETAVEVDRG